MLIVQVTYTAPIEQVDALRPAHCEWLQSGHAAGYFLAWGRRVPPTGGFILATGDRATVEAFAQTDPYFKGGVSTVEVIEVTPGFLAPGLEALGG